MGSKDTYTKAYLTNNAVFADIFNYFIYGGQSIIKPEDLISVDSTEFSVPYNNTNTTEKDKTIQKYRDILKSAAIKQYKNTTYLLLGIESQSEIHYAAPVKTAVYDMLQYEKQVKDIALRHRRNKEYKCRTKGEFLSGFYKDDKLTPVITLVILFSPDKWDCPLSLHDMMDINDISIKGLVQDYKINLIEPCTMTEEDFDKFKTDFQEVMRFIQISSDPDRMIEHVNSSSALKNISTPAAFVINECTNLNITLDDGKETTDMCKAIDILNQRAAKEACIKTAIKMLDKGISKEVVVECTGLTEEEVDNLTLHTV